jgi:hypothetical protein
MEFSACGFHIERAGPIALRGIARFFVIFNISQHKCREFCICTPFVPLIYHEGAPTRTISVVKWVCRPFRKHTASEYNRKE